MTAHSAGKLLDLIYSDGATWSWPIYDAEDRAGYLGNIHEEQIEVQVLSVQWKPLLQFPRQGIESCQREEHHRVRDQLSGTPTYP